MRHVGLCAIASALLLLGACGESPPPGAAPPAPTPAGDATRWHTVGDGKLVRLECERTLYERPGSKHFYVRLRATNLGSRSVALDLRDYRHVPRPNQWGGLSEPRRGEINESRSYPRPLDEELRADLLAARATGRLHTLAPRASLNVFVEFNASGRQDVDEVKAPLWFVSLDGQLLATDGENFQDLSLSWEHEDDDAHGTVIMSLPIAWAQVPTDATVLNSP